MNATLDDHKCWEWCQTRFTISYQLQSFKLSSILVISSTQKADRRVPVSWSPGSVWTWSLESEGRDDLPTCWWHSLDWDKSTTAWTVLTWSDSIATSVIVTLVHQCVDWNTKNVINRGHMILAQLTTLTIPPSSAVSSDILAENYWTVLHILYLTVNWSEFRKQCLEVRKLEWWGYRVVKSFWWCI